MAIWAPLKDVVFDHDVGGLFAIWFGRVMAGMQTETTRTSNEQIVVICDITKRREVAKGRARSGATAAVGIILACDGVVPHHNVRSTITDVTVDVPVGSWSEILPVQPEIFDEAIRPA